MRAQVSELLWQLPEDMEKTSFPFSYSRALSLLSCTSPVLVVSLKCFAL